MFQVNYNKMCHVDNEKWNRQITEEIEQLNQESIGTFGEKET